MKFSPEQINDEALSRHDWRRDEVLALLALPFNELLYRAHSIHRRFHDPARVQVSTLLSIKTGACPEDCAYCPQSAHYNTEVVKERLMSLEEVTAAAQRAKQEGAERFCMGAAWRQPSDDNLERVSEMVGAVKALGLETCVTLGMLNASQAQRLKASGLDYYNHNLDTSPEFYGTVITTRVYQDRLDTLEHVRQAGLKVCAGGILGLGESRADRAGLLEQLANQPEHPESVPINLLVKVEGVPLYDAPDFDSIEFVRVIAAARILMPRSWVRLSAGREEMSDEMQALCFFAGANSIFYGEKLLTTPNATAERDRELFSRLGIESGIESGIEDGPGRAN